MNERRSDVAGVVTAVSAAALPGTEFPLGATPTAGGTNFAVASAADGVLLCLFDSIGGETRIPLGECDRWSLARFRARDRTRPGLRLPDHRAV